MRRKETHGEETHGEGSGRRKGLYSGPTRLEANLGFRDSRREIRNGEKSYGHKDGLRTLAPEGEVKLRKSGKLYSGYPARNAGGPHLPYQHPGQDQ